MKCTLHIGTAKTGTTSIQSFFYKNREELLQKYNVLYPEFIPEFRTGESHRSLSYYAAGDKLLDDPKWNVRNTSEKHEWQKKFKAYFRKGMGHQFELSFANRVKRMLGLAPNCTHYFFSSEHLHSRITNQSQVASIIELLSEFFDEINVVVFLKPQSSLAVSRFSTALKSGKIKDDAFSSITERRIFYNYEKFLNWWVRLLGEKSITIRLMDDSSPLPLDSVDEMCNILNIDKNSLAIPNSVRNSYLCGQSLEFLYVLNDFIHNHNLDLTADFRKSIIHSLERNQSPVRKLPARRSAFEFDQKYLVSNQRLAQQFHLNQPLFTVNYDKYPLMKSFIPKLKVQEAFEHVSRDISTMKLHEADQTAWNQINQFFSNRMKKSKLSNDYGPDYACVGFPKCATTFILKRFAEYSFDTLVKGEFQISRMDEFRPKIKNLHDQGIKVAIKNPNFIYNKHAMDQLQRSGCKIIVSIRNPVRWLKSFYNYRLKRIDQGHEQLPDDFHEIPDFGKILDHDVDFMGVSIKRGMMSKVITQNLFQSDYYDPSRVLYVIQEEFEAEHDKIQNELLDFLEIPDNQRLNREYKFDYNKPKRWKFFNDDAHDARLYELYRSEIRNICSLIHSQTGKDLKSIWENFYSIKID